MAEVNTAEELLINALQDLRAAERVLADDLPPITKKASDKTLVATFKAYSEKGKDAAEAIARDIERLGGEIEGAANIWMAAVIEDATRDTKTIKKGDMRDVALLGALRKGAQAARVSYETAVALAESTENSGTAKLVSGLRDHHAAIDDRLAALLGPLAGTGKASGC